VVYWHGFATHCSLLSAEHRPLLPTAHCSLLSAAHCCLAFRRTRLCLALALALAFAFALALSCMLLRHVRPLRCPPGSRPLIEPLAAQDMGAIHDGASRLALEDELFAKVVTGSYW
jgi:hypothetical protein